MNVILDFNHCKRTFKIPKYFLSSYMKITRQSAPTRTREEKINMFFSIWHVVPHIIYISMDANTENVLSLTFSDSHV